MGVWNLINDEQLKNAIAICSFNHENPNTLNFKIGDRLQLIEETEEWYRGYLILQPNKLGIFPKSFVKIYSSLSHRDSSVYEIESTLKEWTSAWFKKFDEIEKRKNAHCLMGYFSNILNLKNAIVENRASIDEIKELKRSTISKILLGNSLLGLDVIAFDSNYNRLDSSETTTMFLYEELKKNSTQSIQPTVINQPPSLPSFSKDDSINEGNLLHFQHKSINNPNPTSSRSSFTYCVKLSLENLIPSPNCVYTEENSELCVNLFLYKENSIENSYFLCENACFNMAQITNSIRFSSNHINSESTSSLANANSFNSGRIGLFCDISEKDFELTKNGYKLYLVVYAIKHHKPSQTDRHSSISRIFAGGACDLGSNLYNLFCVAADVRKIQSSMILNVNEFENSILTTRTLHDFINSKEVADNIKSGKNVSKESYLTLTFRTELSELSFKNACDKYAHLNPIVCRKMDFPEIIMPDDFRNEFYVTVIGGEFQKARNYEFIVNLVQFKEEGNKLIEVPVDFADDNETSSDSKKKIFFYKSLVYSRQDKPKWNEIVKVSIPHGKKVEEIKETYLRFLIRNRSIDGKDKTKMIGTCYLQITNKDGSAIKDTHCYLPMNKIENETETNCNDGYYFPLRLMPNINRNSCSGFTSSEKLKDFIDVKVKVVSTQLTQNVTLLNLLSFPTDDKPDQERYQSLLTYLDELLSVKDEQSAEIVKFLQAILDKLIDILLDLKTKHTKQDSSTQVSDNKAYEIHMKQIQPRVFEILVAIFQIIENQNKFASFRTVIDAYLSKNFCITLAHRPLLRILSELLNNVYEKYSNNSQVQTPQIINNTKSESNLFLTPQMTNNRSVNNQRISGLSSSASLNSAVHEERDDNVVNTIRSMEYIFKFAFRSRELLSQYSRSNNPHGDVKSDTFDTDVANIFQKLTDITNLSLKNQNSSSNSLNISSDASEANLTKIQSFILKNVITLLPILIQSKRYQIQKISEFYIGFLQSRYILQTQFLSKFIRTKLFEYQESRKVLIGPLCRALTHLITIETSIEDKNKIDPKLESVGKVLAELMDVIEKKNIEKEHVVQDMNEISRMLFQISNIFLYFLGNEENRQLYGSILISIMRTMNAVHYQNLFEWSSNSVDSIETLITSNSSLIDQRINKFIIDFKNITYNDSVSQLIMIRFIYTCQVLLNIKTFQREWFDFLVLKNNVILTAMYHVANRINNHHIENFDELNKQIWYDYFDCMVQLATDSCLQLENFNQNKRKNILNKYDDIRVKAASEIKKMWYNLADKKHNFIPNLVEPFMRVALLPINEIHNAIIPLFFDMINSEHLTMGNNYEFDNYSVPRQLITTLDVQLSFGSGDSKFRNAFERILKEKFNSHINLKNNVGFVKNVVDLFDLLVEYRSLKSDSSDELKTYYLNEILTFYGNLKRYDIYVKYVEILRQIHKSSKNSVCAAYTLKLHAELLFWTNEPIELYLQHPSYPNQTTHKNLKELLFIDLINDFTDGQAWEKAFELSKILRGIYESQYELEKLYPFLRKQSDLCENIIRKERYECKYFLVGFYGKGFPRLLQNKQFVFRSEPLEQIMTFRQRVESWFPKSIRISHSNPLSESEINSDNQYIQIISVHPIYEPKEQFKTLNISTQILKYYHHNEVNRFKFTYRKDTKLNEDDPTLWWLKEKSVLISKTLPDVINFYPVVQETTLDISPIQNAINTVKERLEKLKLAYNKIESNREVSETDKSLIQGTIDPGVLGGLPKYKKFFSSSFMENNPEFIPNVNELKDLVTKTINWGESFLDLALEYLQNDHLLTILKNEQLPKLKNLFDMPVNATLRKQSQARTNLNHSQLVESTPKSGSKQSISLNESVSSNKSFLKQITQVENYSGRALLSYIGDKLSSNQLSMSINNSHRDSISSIKSLNSDEDGSKAKIVLDETVNPKRPLRPNRLTNQNSTSSPSNSNQSSRPISHLSGDDLSSTSLQQINSTLLSTKIHDHLTHEEETDFIDEDPIFKSPPPPKPPKPINVNFNKLNQTNGNGMHSIENLIKNNDTIDQTKSTTSLNSVQFRFLSAKTNSDSVLNKHPEV